MTKEEADIHDRRVSWREWIEIGCSCCLKYPHCKLGKMITGMNEIEDDDKDDICWLVPKNVEDPIGVTSEIKKHIDKDTADGVLPLNKNKDIMFKKKGKTI